MIAQWLREKLSTAVNPASWFIDWIRGEPVTSGVSVTEQTALCYSAVWAATVFVSSAIASLPCLLFRAIAADDRGREVDDWRYGLLKSRPNPEQDSFIFWQEQAMYLVNSGNCYAEKSYFPTGRVAELWPLPPNRVKPYRDGPGGPVRYEITSETGAKRYADRADVLHVTGQLADDGIVGRGVIRQARESIGLGIATERYGGSFFGNSAVPGGVLEHPGKYNEKAEKNLREGWERMHRGPDKGSRTAVLFEGAKFSSIGIDNDDAQFLQTRQHNVTEIARWYGLPPHILADLTRGTFSNIEQQDLEVVKYCLRFWLVRLERALGHQLLGPEEKDLYWEFLLDAFLRGDTATRTAAFVQQFLNGAMTLNEWRRAENRNRIPGEDGDRHFVPLNLVPLDRAGQGRGGRRLRPDGADRGQRPAPGGPPPRVISQEMGGVRGRSSRPGRLGDPARPGRLAGRPRRDRRSGALRRDGGPGPCHSVDRRGAPRGGVPARGADRPRRCAPGIPGVYLVDLERT